MTILLPNIAISGYRSFGAKPAYFDKFSNINIFIGKNNAGKSNVLRLLKEVLALAVGVACSSSRERLRHIVKPGFLA
jgi:AAA15 family ATPase/GTPase